MNKITVDKKKLLKTLKKNRKNHRATFEKALEVYRESAINMLDARLERARKGKKIDLVFPLPTPQDYTESYDTAIAMVEWAEGEVIELEQDDFEQYVQNKWRWNNLFAANTASYLS